MQSVFEAEKQRFDKKLVEEKSRIETLYKQNLDEMEVSKNNEI